MDTSIKTLDQMFERIRFQLNRSKFPRYAKRWEPIYVSSRMRHAAFMSGLLNICYEGRYIPLVFTNMSDSVWEVDIVRYDFT